jgi:hypothetical protein
MLDRRLLARQCVACGYDGAMLRGGSAPRCARCGCDLRVRRPRSYAEMEGLLGESATIERDDDRCHPAQRTIERWIAFLFIAMVAMMGLLYLAELAVPA